MQKPSTTYYLSEEERESIMDLRRAAVIASNPQTGNHPTFRIWWKSRPPPYSTDYGSAWIDTSRRLINNFPVRVMQTNYCTGGYFILVWTHISVDPATWVMFYPSGWPNSRASDQV